MRIKVEKIDKLKFLFSFKYVDNLLLKKLIPIKKINEWKEKKIANNDIY